MGQRCLVTGKKTMVGNRVSHAENKTKRKYRVNLQKKWYWDEETGKKYHLRVSSKGLKTIDKLGLMAALSKIQS